MATQSTFEFVRSVRLRITLPTQMPDSERAALRERLAVGKRLAKERADALKARYLAALKTR